ncbi:MAG: hypothetical protein AB4911_03445 [Oscillochloridaceae bacterium umkhey_bin13]
MIEFTVTMIVMGIATFTLIQIVRAIIVVLTDLFHVFVKATGTVMTVSFMIWAVLSLMS